MKYHRCPSDIMFLLCLLLSAVGCGESVETVTPAVPITERISQTNTKIITADVRSVPDEGHGIVEPPQFDESLELLNGKRISLYPKITGIAERGGRYYQSCSLGNGRFAVACLRGVDFFNIHSEALVPEIQVDTAGEAWRVHLVGETIWVADGYAGVVALDVDTGKEMIRWPELTMARAFHTMDDGRVVVCRHSAGAELLSVSDGITIRDRIHIDAGKRVFSAASDRNRLFLGTLHGGYTAMEVNPGETTRILWTYTDCTRIVWCQYVNGIHYLLDQDLGLLVLADRGSDPPQLLATLALAGQSRHACLQDPAHLVIANQMEIYLVDIKSPSEPKILDHMPACMEGWGIGIVEDRIVSAESEFGLRILERQEGSLRETGRYQHNGLVAEVSLLHPDRAVVTQTHKGVAIMDVGEERLEVTDRWEDCEYPVAASVDESRIALTDYSGMVIIQAEPGLPLQKISSLKTPGRAVNLAAAGDYIYIADWFQGLHIVNVSDPGHPAIVANVPTEGWVIDVVIQNGYAYVCAIDQGLMTVDIHDPMNPKVLHCDESSRAPEAAVIGKQCLYVADFNFGLIVYNLVDPANPIPFSCCRMPVCKNVVLRDNLLIVSNYIYGLKWFDIVDPLRPVLIGEIDTPGKGYGATFIPDKNEILVADWHDLIRVAW